MLINVNDPELNLILNGCMYIVVGVGFLTLGPWSLKSGRNRWTAVLPLPALAAYTFYEVTMPGNWDIRIDLLLLWPLLLVITLIGLLRFAAINKLSAAEK